MNKQVVFIVSLFIAFSGFGQTKVAITIDDVPNTRQYYADGFRSELLERLDSLQIPVAIFINEGLIGKTEFIDKNKQLLNDWVAKPYTTLGNHSYSHLRYSDVGTESFKADVVKGQVLTNELAIKHNKSLQYFRFPFNDLGKDKAQHDQMAHVLDSLGYISTPFTVESSDWMYSYIYDYYLEQGDKDKAKKVGDQYISKTMEYFQFFDSLSMKLYGRSVSQIYLCHDNALNAKYLPKVLHQLKMKQYQFVSLEQAMKDPVYQQKDVYDKKWGISWLYRWMDAQEERVKWMKAEPTVAELELQYNQLQKKK
ncbi:MAG: polysaccharide deacetylase family protein [Cyclobacteriaceae bacterium]